MKLGPYLHDLFNLNYLLKGPTSKYSKSHAGLGLQQELGGDTVQCLVVGFSGLC